MKKILILFIALILSNYVKSQFYIGVSGGYALGLGKSYTGLIITDSENKMSSQFLSFGQGFRVSASSYYQMDNHLLLGVDINYTKTPLFTLETIGDELANNYIYTKQRSALYDAVPFVGFQMDNGMYGRLGMIVTISQITEIESRSKINDYGMDALSHGRETGRVSLGAMLVVGYNYHFSDKISLFGEMQMRLLSIKPKKGNLIDATNLGQDVMPIYHTNKKEWLYKDEYENVQTPDPDYLNKPENRFYSEKNIISHSSIGILFGVRFGF